MIRMTLVPALLTVLAVSGCGGDRGSASGYQSEESIAAEQRRDEARADEERRADELKIADAKTEAEADAARADAFVEFANDPRLDRPRRCPRQ